MRPIMHVNKKYLILSCVSLTIAVLLAASFLLTRYYLSPPNSDATLTNFTVQKGESLTAVADELEKQGFIRNALAFRLIVQISGYQDKVQAGTFQLSHNLSLKEVAYELYRGSTDHHITTLEGWRIEEVAEYLDSQKIVTKAEFLDAASSFNTSKYSFLPQYQGTSLDHPYRKLEGYLFPDTYEIANHATAPQIIQKMIADFAARIPESLSQTTNGLSFNQSLTLASIIEREARTDTDRAIAAGILKKRYMTQGWKLDSDVTVQFALGYDKSGATWWKKDLTVQNLAINSAYNTRKFTGLPPTPIDNPSLSSIKAALKPTTTDYWYYLSGKDGIMHYAKTIQEHSANIARYL
jgi:UPF0755 protein